MSKIDYAELLPDYLMGRLDTEKRKEVENALARSEPLRKQLEDEKLLRQVILRKERKELMDRVQQWENEPQGFNWKIWAVAASISIVVLAGFFVWKNLDLNQDASYLSYFESYPNTVLPFERGEGNIDPAKEAFMAYENNQFSEAAILFEALNKIAVRDEWVFYEAISKMELHQWELASELLQNHTWASTEPGSFGDVKEWYLALALLYSGDVANAKDLLTEIFNRKGYEYINAGKLLEQLNATENN